MKVKLILSSVFLSLCVLGLVVNYGSSPVMGQSEEIPIVDFKANNRPESPYDQEIRRQRGNKYKSHIPLVKMEDQETVLIGQPSHWPVEAAFPVKASDMVVVGTVTAAEAFVSEDKTAIYSQFQIQVTQILKDNIRLNVAVSSIVVADRIGGRVRFPSGLIQRWGEFGRGLPKKERQYILFLKWDELAKDFSILTGYEINRDTISPLDGNLEGDAPGIFANYAKYRNASLKKVLSEIVELVNLGGTK